MGLFYVGHHHLCRLPNSELLLSLSLRNVMFAYLLAIPGSWRKKGDRPNHTHNSSTKTARMRPPREDGGGGASPDVGKKVGGKCPSNCVDDPDGWRGGALAR